MSGPMTSRSKVISSGEMEKLSNIFRGLLESQMVATRVTVLLHVPVVLNFVTENVQISMNFYVR